MINRREFFRTLKFEAKKTATALIPETPLKSLSNLEINSNGLQFADIKVSAECIGCNVCEALCEPGAIKRVLKDGYFTLKFSSQLCTGCGICASKCLPKAIKLNKIFNLESILENNEREVLRLPMSRCVGCGDVVVGEKKKLCPSCLKRHINI